MAKERPRRGAGVWHVACRDEGADAAGGDGGAAEDVGLIGTDFET